MSRPDSALGGPVDHRPEPADDPRPEAPAHPDSLYRPPRRDRPRWRTIEPADAPEHTASAEGGPGTPTQGENADAAGAVLVEGGLADAEPAAPDPAPAPPVRVARARAARRAEAAAEAAGFAQGVFTQEVFVQRVQMASRTRPTDPTFALLILFALNIGLSPIVPANSDLRLTALWALMGGFAASVWLFGRNPARIEPVSPDRLAWGSVFGLIVALPLLLVGGETLVTTARLFFRTEIGGVLQTLPQGVVLTYLFLVMPLAETLFFRGAMQVGRPVLVVGGAASAWSVFLLFPMLDLGRVPAIALLMAVSLVLVNMTYSYVRARSGLASAWVCQVVVNALLFYLPYLIGAGQGR
jgi:hypothetical protein